MPVADPPLQGVKGSLRCRRCRGRSRCALFYPTKCIGGFVALEIVHCFCFLSQSRMLASALVTFVTEQEGELNVLLLISSVPTCKAG